MKYRNKIKEKLAVKGLSIKGLAEKLKRDYANVHSLVSDDYLDLRHFANVADVADALELEVEDLFEVEDE